MIVFSGQAVSSPLSHIFRIFRLARGTHSRVGVIVVCDGFSMLLKIIVARHCFSDARNQALIDRRSRCDTQRMTVQTPFAKE